MTEGRSVVAWEGGSQRGLQKGLEETSGGGRCVHYLDYW